MQNVQNYKKSFSETSEIAEMHKKCLQTGKRGSMLKLRKRLRSTRKKQAGQKKQAVQR
jgi:hypothetical protein